MELLNFEDIQTCTVRRHHTFEEARNAPEAEANGAKLGVSPAAWKRSFSERGLPRLVSRPAPAETIRVEKESSEQILLNYLVRRHHSIVCRRASLVALYAVKYLVTVLFR